MGLNIMVLNRDMGLGGGNTFLRNLAPPLQHRGHRCILVCGPGRESESLLKGAFDQVIERRLVFPWDGSWLAGMIRKYRVDLVDATAIIQMPVAVRACRVNGTPLVLNFQAPFPSERAAKLLPAADSIMVMNEYQRGHFQRMGAPAEKIWRCQWLMDWDAYAAKARPPEQRRYDAVYCSRFSRTKTPVAVAFIDALRDVLQDRPKLRALVVGFGRGLPTVEEAAERLNGAEGRKVVEIKTGVFDTAQFFGDALIVVGGHYVAIEGMAAGAYAVGAGYDGVYGLVTPENLEEATEQSFGDHMTPVTGVERDDADLVPDLRKNLRLAFENVASGWKDSPSPYARPIFRREDAIDVVERHFVKTARGSGSD